MKNTNSDHDILVKARDIVIEFPIFNASHRSFKKTLLETMTGGKLTSNASHQIKVRAIDQASFSFKRGDRIGLLGHNGAGKTTLLRSLAGVYTPTSGMLHVHGQIVSLLDISMGLDSEATGFENIFLKGVLLGMTPKEIARKLNAIAEFSELGDYLNLPVRTYSSGMLLRLGFSVTASLQADVLLMDEWLSVGDTTFNEKVQKKIREMVQQSSVLVIATHAKATIKSLCNRVFVLEKGKICEQPIENINH